MQHLLRPARQAVEMLRQRNAGLAPPGTGRAQAGTARERVAGDR